MTTNETPLVERLREWALEKPWEYEPHFSQWMGQLTEYALYDKADIALVLAMQSAEIERLQSELAQAQRNKVEQARANQELMAQLIEAQKDAERYRYLRDAETLTPDAWDAIESGSHPSSFDAAIDRAIAEQG